MPIRCIYRCENHYSCWTPWWNLKTATEMSFLSNLLDCVTMNFVDSEMTMLQAPMCIQALICYIQRHGSVWIICHKTVATDPCTVNIHHQSAICIHIAYHRLQLVYTLTMKVESIKLTQGSVYGLSQWETTLHFNVGSRWLSPYTEWCLLWKKCG